MLYTTTKLNDAIDGLLNETGDTVFVLHFHHGAKYRRIGNVGYSIAKTRTMCKRIENANQAYDEEMHKTVTCIYDIDTDELRVDIEADNERDYLRCQELLEML